MVDQEKTTDVVRMSKHGQKETLLVNTATYDYLANSAGQDNLGQILGALISFERLADAMGEEYRGGLLLIDELDVTLFPSSQVRLFDLLKERAAAQRVQVVFTTHSMTLLEKAVKETQGKNDTVKVLYLKKRESGIRLTIDPPIEEIQADLMVEPLRPKKGPKVEIWCEDDEAKWVLGQIMPSRLKRKCDIVSAKLSCGELGELAVRDIASLRGVCFVVDADSNRGAPEDSCYLEAASRLSSPYTICFAASRTKTTSGAMTGITPSRSCSADLPTQSATSSTTAGIRSASTTRNGSGERRPKGCGAKTAWLSPPSGKRGMSRRLGTLTRNSSEELTQS